MIATALVLNFILVLLLLSEREAAAPDPLASVLSHDRSAVGPPGLCPDGRVLSLTAASSRHLASGKPVNYFVVIGTRLKPGQHYL